MGTWFRAAVTAGMFMAAVMTTGVADAGEHASLLDVLLKKGIISQSEHEAISEEQKAGEQEEQVQINTRMAEAIEYNKQPENEDRWEKRVQISGLLEGEYRWMKFGDVGDKESDGMSDLYVRRLELGVDMRLTDWIQSHSVLNSEYIGDAVNQGDELLTVDEAVITIQKDDVPFYLVLGKRAQPFGVFENHLVTDPMTQDAYETKRVGVTIGATGPAGLDLSATLYKGEEQMDHLVESGLFESYQRKPGNDVDSYILSVSLSPLEEMVTLFGGVLSEPGRGSRNDTANAGVSVGLGDLKLDAECMKALKREKYDQLDNAFKEGVYSVTASFVIGNGHGREVVGGASFEERREHIFEEPLHFAFRYEWFDDDHLAEKTSSWSAESRYSLGVRYPFYRNEENELAAYVSAEYRHTDYRLFGAAKDERADGNEETYIRLGAAF